MGNYQVLSEQIEKIQNDLREKERVMGALHVLVRIAMAEAEAATHNAEAVRTLKKMDTLIARGYLNYGTNRGDIVFGEE